jgi:hypothetical protein
MSEGSEQIVHFLLLAGFNIYTYPYRVWSDCSFLAILCRYVSHFPSTTAMSSVLRLENNILHRFT